MRLLVLGVPAFSAGPRADVAWGGRPGVLDFVVQPADRSRDGLFRTRFDRALAAGLRLRPAGATLADLWTSLPGDPS